MPLDDKAMNAAKARYLAAEERYEKLFAPMERAIIKGFLDRLAQRKAMQSEILQDLTREATSEIGAFSELRVSFAERLNSLFAKFDQVGSAAHLLVLSQFLEPGGAGPSVGADPLQWVVQQQADLLARQQRAAEAKCKADDALQAAGAKTVDMLDGATGVIVLRAATLKAFRRENLDSSLKRIRDAVVDELNDELVQAVQDAVADELQDELGEALNDQIGKRLVDLVLEYGGEFGVIVADQLPVVGLGVKLVSAVVKGSLPPEKYNDIGGGDILMYLTSALRRERQIFEGFKKELNGSFGTLVEIETSMNGPSTFALPI